VKDLPRVDGGLTRRIVLAAAVSLLAWAGLESLSPRPRVTWSEEMHDAAERMREGIDVIAAHLGTMGIEIDEAIDPTRTGLIGPEYTELFTTLGQVEAKRTTTNPDVAALMVYLLRRAGGAHPAAIISLGSSSYGATRTDLDLLHIYRLLLAAGVISTPPSAISLGGERDVGADFEPAFRESLLDRIQGSEIPLLHDPDLRENVVRRMAIYLGAVDVAGASEIAPEGERAAAGRVTAFVNIGGNEANLGTSPMILDVAPGLNENLPLPPSALRGVLYEMSALGIPVIHLLHVRGLALSHGLPWDPVPLPEPGTTPLIHDEENRGWPFWIITGGYLAALLVIVVTARVGRVKEPG